MSIIMPRKGLVVPARVSPWVYLGKKRETDAAHLAFPWALDCEVLCFEFRKMKPKSASEQFARLQLSNDGGLTYLAGTSYAGRSVAWDNSQFQAVVTGGASLCWPTSTTTVLGMDSTAGEYGYWTFYLTRPFDTGSRTRIFGHGFHTNINGLPTTTKHSGRRQAADRTDAMRFSFTDAGGSVVDNLEGEVRVYGLLRHPGGIQAAPSYRLPQQEGVEPVWEFIGQKEADNSGVGLEFTWDYPYDKVQAWLHDVAPATGAESIDAEFWNGSAWLQTGYETRANLWATGTATSTGSIFAKITTRGAANAPAAGSVAGSGISGLVELHNPSDSSRMTHLTSLSGFGADSSVTEVPCHSWGQHTTAAKHNGIRFQVHDRASGNMERGTITLLGKRRLAA